MNHWPENVFPVTKETSADAGKAAVKALLMIHLPKRFISTYRRKKEQNGQ